jgi:hypothetical protein
MNPTLKPEPDEPADRELPHRAASWTDAFTGPRVAGLISLFLVVLYPGVIVGSHSLFFRDFGLFTYPVAFHAHESFWRGEVPLWNPLNNGGVPFLAQWNTSVCYPPSLIYLLLPLPWSLNLFCLGHLVLAGAGMFLLAERWTQNRLAAAMAAVAFALNGLMLNSLIWTSNLAALSWQPLVILCVERAWRLGGRRRLAVAALAGAMQMLSGAPEIIVFTWVLLAVLGAAEARRKQIAWGPLLRRSAAIVALVSALAAIQLLPFFDLFRHCERDTTYAAADAWPMPSWGWANLIVPLFHCSRTALGVYMQSGQDWTSSYYLGIAVLALACVGGVQARRFPRWWLAGAAFAGLVLALGHNGFVYTWLKQVVPWIGFARYPIKFVTLPVFAIPLLAAYGFAQVNAPDNTGRRNKPLFGAGAFLLAAATAILCIAWRFPAPKDAVPDTIQNGVIRVIFLAGTTSLIVVLVRAKADGSRRLLGFALLVLVALDLTTAGMHVNPTVTSRAFGPIELNMSHRPRPGESRAMLSAEARQFFGWADTADPLYYCIGSRGALFENCNIPEKVPKVDGFCSLHLKEEAEVARVLYADTNAFPAPLADFLGVSQVSAPGNLFAWQARTTSLPLATAGQQPVFAGAAETLAAIGSEQFNPRRTVYLPVEAKGRIAANGFSETRILDSEFAAHRIRLVAEAPAPAMVVVAQSYYHNWRAFVDGKPVPLWRANHAYQAVEIPPGRHEVVLKYRDTAFRAGAVVSALALGICAFAWFSERRKGA